MEVTAKKMIALAVMKKLVDKRIISVSYSSTTSSRNNVITILDQLPSDAKHVLVTII